MTKAKEPSKDRRYFRRIYLSEADFQEVYAAAKASGDLPEQNPQAGLGAFLVALVRKVNKP